MHQELSQGVGWSWVGISCHQDLPTWRTHTSAHTALAVNNEPLQSSTCTKHRYERLAEALQLYSALQRSTSLQLYILYSIHPSTAPLSSVPPLPFDTVRHRSRVCILMELQACFFLYAIYCTKSIVDCMQPLALRSAL